MSKTFYVVAFYVEIKIILMLHIRLQRKVSLFLTTVLLWLVAESYEFEFLSFEFGVIIKA